MSWGDLIKTQVDEAFVLLDDLVKDMTWTARTSPIFNDGSYTYSESEKSIGGVMAKYATRRVDGVNILATDQELIVKQNEVGDLGSDDLFLAAEVLYKVIDFDQDPSNTIWTIQLRAA